MVSFHHVQYQKKLMLQSRENLVTDRQTDGRVISLDAVRLTSSVQIYKFFECLQLVSKTALKVNYVRKKNFFHVIIVLNVQCIIFFTWKKNDVLFSIYLDFCVFGESTNLKSLWRHNKHAKISQTFFICQILV